MLKMKKNRRRRVYFNYDYLANASRKISMCGLMSLENFIIKEMGKFERLCHTGGILSEREGGGERKVVFFFS